MTMVVTLSFGPNGKEWVFMFKERQAAEFAVNTIEVAKTSLANGALHAPLVKIVDDFGQHFCGDAKQVHAFALEDLDSKHDANGELQLAQFRAGLRLEQKVNADPDPGVRSAIARAKQQSIIHRAGPVGMGPMPQIG